VLQPFFRKAGGSPYVPVNKIGDDLAEVGRLLKVHEVAKSHDKGSAFAETWG
jgi:hypothetical protein